MVAQTHYNTQPNIGVQSRLNHLVIARDNIVNVFAPPEASANVPFDFTAGVELDRLKNEFEFVPIFAAKRPFNQWTELGVHHIFDNAGFEKSSDARAWRAIDAVELTTQEITICVVARCNTTETSSGTRRMAVGGDVGLSYRASTNSISINIIFFNGYRVLSNGAVGSDGEWHTWIAQYRPSFGAGQQRTRCWFDGILELNIGGPTTPMPVVTHLSVGSAGPGRNAAWNGDIAHVQISDRFLSVEQCIHWSGSPFEVLYRPERRQIGIEHFRSVPTVGDLDIEKFLDLELDVDGVTKGSINVDAVVDAELNVDETVNGTLDIDEAVTGTLDIEPVVEGSLEIG